MLIKFAEKTGRGFCLFFILFFNISILSADIEFKNRLKEADIEFKHTLKADEYLKTFVQNFGNIGNKNINYDSNTDTFVMFADPSVLHLVVLGLGTVGLGVLGAACFIASSYTQKIGEKFGALLIGALAAGGTFWVGKKFEEYLTMKLNKTPYITLNDEGLRCFDNLKFSWKDLYGISVSTITTYRDGHYVSSHRVANFDDRYRNSLFELSEITGLLPMKFDNFLAICEHYMQKYEKASAK